MAFLARAPVAVMVDVNARDRNARRRVWPDRFDVGLWPTGLAQFFSTPVDVPHDAPSPTTRGKVGYPTYGVLRAIYLLPTALAHSLT